MNMNKALKQCPHWTNVSGVPVSELILSSMTYGPCWLYSSLLLCPHPLARDPHLSLPTNGKPPKPSIYLSWGSLLSRLSNHGTQQPSGWFPFLPEFSQPCPVISVPRAQCEGSRREGWLPGQRRIKPSLCQAADWLRHVPPSAILRVGGQREVSPGGQGDLPVSLASPGLPPPSPVRVLGLRSSVSHGRQWPRPFSASSTQGRCR